MIKLNLEILEDRFAPAVFQWFGFGADHNWTTNNNWLHTTDIRPTEPAATQNYPTAGDIAIISGTFSYTINYNDTGNLDGLIFDGGSSCVLSLQNNLSVNGYQFEQDSGDITATSTSRTLTLNGITADGYAITYGGSVGYGGSHATLLLTNDTVLKMGKDFGYLGWDLTASGTFNGGIKLYEQDVDIIVDNDAILTFGSNTTFNIDTTSGLGASDWYFGTSTPSEDNLGYIKLSGGELDHLSLDHAYELGIPIYNLGGIIKLGGKDSHGTGSVAGQTSIFVVDEGNTNTSYSSIYQTSGTIYLGWSGTINHDAWGAASLSCVDGYLQTGGTFATQGYHINEFMSSSNKSFIVNGGTFLENWDNIGTDTNHFQLGEFTTSDDFTLGAGGTIRTVCAYGSLVGGVYTDIGTSIISAGGDFNYGGGTLTLDKVSDWNDAQIAATITSAEQNFNAGGDFTGSFGTVTAKFSVNVNGSISYIK